MITRRQAIQDGVLVEVLAGAETPFKYPVAFTATLWAEIVRGAGNDEDTRNARVWDVCFDAFCAARVSRPGERVVCFNTIVGRRKIRLRADCGRDDDGKQCITVGFPED